MGEEVGKHAGKVGPEDQWSGELPARHYSGGHVHLLGMRAQPSSVRCRLSSDEHEAASAQLEGSVDEGEGRRTLGTSRVSTRLALEG